jgi:dimeric dUTPase (all-alpha-NTP-PPase superfamily)
MENNWLLDLFKMQKELDDFIEKKISYSGTIDENINALFVELGEFLNEVKAFKYWSTKSMDKEKAYEEFVDGLHFLLSLGNKMWVGVSFDNLNNRISKMKVVELDLTDEVDRSSFVRSSNSLIKNSAYLNGTLEDYENYFYSFVRLGFLIGMDIGDLVSEYKKKNLINYQRQRDGY